MIFVTVGTTMPFDELLEETDRLAGEGVLGEDVTVQYGQSAYRMRHGTQFMARPSIDSLLRDASLVVTHGGSTVIQLIALRRPFVAFPNPRGAGDHQTSFLAQVAEVADISWSRDVRDLARLVAERRRLGPAMPNATIPRAADVIRPVLKAAAAATGR